MYIIADAHVDHTLGNVDEFFEMLAALAETDEDVVFLGDIFELWVSLPRYEEAQHERFLDWCRREKERRTVGFVEGNREFYVVRRHRAHFSWSSERRHREGELLCVHGDLINRKDHQYLWWRRISKNPFARTFFRFLPDGPERVHKMRVGMKKTNMNFRLGLPHDQLARFARACFRKGVRTILVGHFHEFYLFEEEGRRLIVLPDWHSSGQIGHLDAEGVLTTASWRDLTAATTAPKVPSKPLSDADQHALDECPPDGAVKV